MKGSLSEVIFTPDNEPYLGRELLFHFDNAICECLEQSGKIAPKRTALTRPTCKKRLVSSSHNPLA